MSVKKLDILGFGEPLMELAQKKDNPKVYLSGFGGDVSNCLVAAARSKAKVGIFTHIGNDRFADAFLELWQKEGIDTSAVKKNFQAPTGIYFITYDNGRDFFYYRKGSAASSIAPADIPKNLLAGVKCLHISAITQAISKSSYQAVNLLIKLASQYGVKISYDTNFRLCLWDSFEQAQKTIIETVRKANVLLPSYDDLKAITGLEDTDAMLDWGLEAGVEVIALTCGDKGVLVASSQERKFFSAHSIPSNTEIDATGAGDTFDGTFLSKWIAGQDIFSAALYANTAAGISVTRTGAVRSIPCQEEIEAKIKEISQKK